MNDEKQLSAHQRAIVDAITEAGHVVEWRDNSYHLALHIDGVDTTWRRDDERGRVGGVRSERYVVWRERKLSADPKKAAAALLERHAAKLSADATWKESNERQLSREDRERALYAVLNLPNSKVVVAGDGVTFIFRVPDVTPEKAAQIGAAIRGAL